MTTPDAQLTAEQIKAIAATGAGWVNEQQLSALCDIALRSLAQPAGEQEPLYVPGFETTKGEKGVCLEDGVWQRVQNPFLHGCCDCGLCHRMHYRVVDDELEIKVFRNEAETERLRTALNAAPPQPAPQGEWVSVPREPTEAMQDAMLACIKDGIAINDDVHRSIRHGYRAMLSAAPDDSQSQKERKHKEKP